VIVANPTGKGLKPFKPGAEWTGNPGGRPKGESFTAVLRELLDREHRKAPDWRNAIAAKAIELASKGDLDAIKWIADRTDGKVTDVKTVEHSGQVKQVVEVTYSRRAHQPGSAGTPPEPGGDQA
jgi:hypothetical protein